ncbi:Aste57867_21899 [Aphanomyces stellatus]|uniref:Aste57867_21899 protein n=1 Tax=Aphanomyces stellatus TaxID=120398 RepID=A0A485LIS4_9STRA|nr:hypothetical protein As57867_021830 [Aphanomyces stellatus]VFT98567.1 Aste57867_21899 [Aphanomyces stellatus]
MQRRRKTKGKDESPLLPNEQKDVEKDAPLDTPMSDPVMWTVGAVVLGVYSQTLYPSIAGGDSGELVAESCHLGISHPPGYPLFNMLNYLVVNMPGEQTKAWKANFFSAVCDTACCMLMYATIVSWRPSEYPWLTKIAAATASMSFAFSPLIWTYAISAEVFALNNLFAALLLFTLLRYAQSGTWFHVCQGAFVSGLALCNQHTIVLFEAPIVLWVLWTQRRNLTFHAVGQLAFYFVLGLLPYTYMPLASYWNPQPGSWGDVTSLGGFFHHLRRGDYGTFRLFATDRVTESLATRLSLYFHDAFVREGAYVLAPLALIGMTQRPLARSSSLDSVGFVVVFVYAFYLVVFHSLSNLPLTEGLLYGVHMRFWQQPNVVLFVWGGVGLSALLRRVHASSKGLGCAAAMLALAAAASQGATWYPLGNQSQAWYIHNYAKALLDSLPQNALVFVNYDLQWTAMRYLQRCESFRPDLTVINLSMMTYKWFGTKHPLYPKIKFPGDRLVPASSQQDGGFTMRELLDANIRRFPAGIFLGGQLNYPDPTFQTYYSTEPYGLLDKFHPAAKPIYKSLKKWHRRHQATMATVHAHLTALPPPHLYNDETWEWTVARDYHMKVLSVATFFLDEITKGGANNITWLAEAARPMEHSVMYEPPQFWAESVLKNLGLAYAYIVKSTEDFPAEMPSDPFEPHVGRNVVDKTKWKDRASERMLEVWRQWIALPSAKADLGFPTIADIVAKFSQS